MGNNYRCFYSSPMIIYASLLVLPSFVLLMALACQNSNNYEVYEDQEWSMRPSELSFPSMPVDLARANISQEEYSTMVNLFLETLQNNIHHPQRHYSFEHSGEDVNRFDSLSSLFFKTDLDPPFVEDATLKLIVDAIEHINPKKSMAKHKKYKQFDVKVYEIMSNGTKYLVGSTTLHPHLLPKWTDIDVVKATMRGDVKFELECASCRIRLSSPYLNVLVNREDSRRSKRAATAYREKEGVDCKGKRFDGTYGDICCLEEKYYFFKDNPNYEYILLPKGTRVGVCLGSCEYDFIPTNVHVDLLDRAYRSDVHPNARPSCCVPSLYESLNVLHLKPENFTRLQISKFDKVRALDCSCV